MPPPAASFWVMAVSVIALSITAPIVLSFFPMALLSLPFLFLSLPMCAALAGCLWLLHARSRTARAALARLGTALQAWFAFLLPFHAIFAVGVVAAFSLAWSLCVGGLLFAFPAVVDAFRLTGRPQRWLARARRTMGLYAAPLLPAGAVDDLLDVRAVKWAWALDVMGGLMRPVMAYFPIAIRRSAPLPPDTPFLFGYHPHGIYAYGLFSLVFPEQSGWARQFPGSRDMLVAVANALLSVPVCGHLFKWFGFVSAERRSVRAALASERSLALIPGGIAEMLLWRRGVDRLYLAKRRGFVRLAIQSGRALVPVFAFGESATFKEIALPGPLERLRARLSRRFRVALIPFRGRWCTLLPFAVPITVVVGRPVAVDREEEPSDATVDRVHAAYVAELRRVYAEHRDELAPGRELIIE